MRNAHSAFITCLLSLVLLSSAQPGRLAGARPNPKKGVDPLNTITARSTTFPSTAALASSNTEQAISSSTVSPITIPITRTTILSYVPTSTSNSESSHSSISTSTIPTGAITDGYIGSTLVSSSSPYSISMSSSSSSNSVNNSEHHRNLIIILSAVLGFAGLLLIISVIFLIVRYRRGKSPFAHRGASPINDEEIASWRGTIQEHKPPVPNPTLPPVLQDANTIGLAQSPGWTWAPSPSAVQPSMSQTASVVPDTPPFLAKAPNSRAGLTDETVPGAHPFIPPMKRQTSRLSKAPPGHARTKSRRSSLSAKSMWSFKDTSMDLKGKELSPTWFDPENDHVARELRDLDHNSESPGTSIFDGLSAGGLSPRPKSRPRLWESEKEHEHGRTLA
ncbi:hypothetical protein LSUE1_G000296 [Lachnellula suecica]|uniref:Mid2 domain-containing protein n=1 Tax=Lachnellula suecica TaxID=602035 RepID=A0A8T9CJQ5_9HELO|nr:hypothetical protein LSUE1_G000296 [Lachnellula suecica]